MSKEKLYGLRDQLGKFLYDPTPDQAAWRDKMWEEGRFDEILKTTKQVEEQFDYVEKQIEAFEAAEPELGEKIVANTLLNLPLARGLKGTGLGSLLGIAEEELGAAETQRLDDIKKEINQLNAIRQRDLEGGKVTSGTISKIDADIRALENEGAELKQLLSTPLSEEPEDRKRRLFEEFIKDKTDLTFAEEEFLKAYPEFGSPSLRQLTPEQILEELGAQEGTVFDEELLKNAEGLAKSMGISTEDLQKALQQGEKEGLMSLIGDTPTTGEAGPPSPPSGPPSPPSGGDGNGGPTREDVLKFINTLSLKERLGAYTPYGELYDEEIFQYEDLFDWDKDVVNWENIPDDYRSEGQELARAFFEKNQISEKFETDLVKEFTYRGKSQPYFENVGEGFDKVRVRTPIKGTDYGSGSKYRQKTFTNPTYGELKEWYKGLEKGYLGLEDVSHISEAEREIEALEKRLKAELGFSQKGVSITKKDFREMAKNSFNYTKEVQDSLYVKFLKDVLEGKVITKHKSGGLIMNYGDYGRSYT